MAWLASHWESINALLMMTSIGGILVSVTLLFLRRSSRRLQSKAFKDELDWAQALDCFVEGNDSTPAPANAFLKKLEEEYQRYQSIERGLP